MYLIYSLLLTSVGLLGLPYLLYRHRHAGGYARTLKERLGWLPAGLDPSGEGSVWIHAVSVGEVLAAKTLLPPLKQAFPDTAIFLSVTTSTGRQIAERQVPEVDGIFYCPYDFALSVRRVVRRLNPMLLLVVETEIWPHLFRECRRHGAVTLLVNGRISDKSFPRYRRIRPFIACFLREVDHFCMQSRLYAERIEALGGAPERITVTGSVKFDAPLNLGSPGEASALVPSGRTVLVGGSTLAPEEDLLIELFSRLVRDYPDLFLVLAPRQPPRFDEVYRLAVESELSVVRRSRLTKAPQEAQLMILDTLGELASLYRSADIVFVGGSIAPWGGHNIIEPAAFGKPVLFGPHMDNFRDIARLFVDSGAGLQVADAATLAVSLRELLGDPERRRKLGERARRLVESERGAARRTVAIAQNALAAAAPVGG